jgi:hypothetical protein
MKAAVLKSTAAIRRAGKLALAVAGAMLPGCTAHEKLLGFGLPPGVPTEGIARAAFLANVNVTEGSITITAPQRGMAWPASLNAGVGGLSLVGGDAVLLTTSNFHASPLGAFQPNKIRITFDISLTNRLANIRIVGPAAFPTPPPGTTGPLLIPYDIAIATTSGGLGGGNDVVVVLPSVGLVAPSTEWDGAPWNFFNDSSCATGNDCFRWEEFADIDPGASSAPRTVGFDIDPTVGQFTARLIVGSDLFDLNAPPPGAIQGAVVSAALGPLAGVTVTANPTGASMRTDANGGFSFSGLGVGSATLTLSDLPEVCTTPPPAVVTVNSGTTITVTLNVPCSPPPLVGTLTGTIQSSSGAPLSGITVTVQPTGLSAEPAVASDALGNYLVSNVDVADGTGTFSLGNLPSGCTDPGAIPYTDMANGATVTINVTVACP